MQTYISNDDLSRHNIIVDPETFEVKAIMDWESSGFYPAEFEAGNWVRSLQEYVPDDVATDRLIGLLDHPPAAESHATMVDIPDGIIYIWQTEYRDNDDTLTPSTFTNRQMRSYEKKLIV